MQRSEGESCIFALRIAFPPSNPVTRQFMSYPANWFSLSERENQESWRVLIVHMTSFITSFAGRHIQTGTSFHGRWKIDPLAPDTAHAQEFLRKFTIVDTSSASVTCKQSVHKQLKIKPWQAHYQNSTTQSSLHLRGAQLSVPSKFQRKFKLMTLNSVIVSQLW